MKYALEHNADYFLLLNNDTVVDKSFLDYMVERGESSEEIGIINPKIYFYEQPDCFWFAGGEYSLWIGLIKHIGLREKDAGQYDEPKEITAATGCAFMIKKSVVEKIGYLYDDFFIYSEDVEYTLRALKAGYKAFYEPRAVIWHKESITIKKVLGKTFHGYLATRNILQTHKKYARFYHYLTAYPYFFFRWILMAGINQARIGNFSYTKGILLGVVAFLRGDKGPPKNI
jgi:GT2 family glycosyltransferase